MGTKKEALFLRVDPELNAKLKDKAESLNLSLNEYCVSQLARSLRNSYEHDSFKQIIRKAKHLFKENLLAIVIFGSYARDELTDESDLDILIVLDSKVEITRELYTKWDKKKIETENLYIQTSIHFSKIPDNSLSGFWCEVALDGIVIYDKLLIVSRFLIKLRKMILSGSFIAKYSHGHRYWLAV